MEEDRLGVVIDPAEPTVASRIRTTHPLHQPRSLTALERERYRQSAKRARAQARLAAAVHPVYPHEHLEAMARLILDTPSLRTRDLQKYQEWEVLLVPNIAQRLLRSGSLPRTDVHDAARSIVGAAVAALRVATERWLHSDGVTDPTAVLDELIAVVRTA